MNKKLNLKYLEKEIDLIKERNKKVEIEKNWEISLERKISIWVITYITIVVIMYFLKFENILISALIPTFWYIISTSSLKFIKNIYMEKRGSLRKN